MAGASTYPARLDLPSLQGVCTPGAVRAYQAWYRDSAPYCTVDGFNLTNGILAIWGP